MMQQYKTTNQPSGERIYAEQIAFQVERLDSAIDIYKEMGHTEWILDEVHANNVAGLLAGTSFKVKLGFNYTMFPGKEFELLEYIEGHTGQVTFYTPSTHQQNVSHIGLHVENIEKYIDKNPLLRDCDLIQLTETQWHAGTSRRYRYALIDTVSQIGFITKLIQRRE